MRVAVRIALVIESGPGWGSGHAVRAATLARALGRRHEVRALTPTPTLVRRIFRTFGVTTPITRAEIRPASLRRSAASVYVVDHLATSAELVRDLRGADAKVVTFDDSGPGAGHADLVINAIIGRWSGRTQARASRVLSGLHYLILSPAFHVRHSRRRQRTRVLNVVLGLGGLATRSEIDAARAALPRDVRIVATGTFAGGRPRPLAPLIAGADLAITNGGLTMYEALALGVPTVAIPQTTIERRSVRLAAQRGALVASARGRLAIAIRDLAADRSRRARLAQRGRALVDGRGLARVISAIEQLGERA